MVRMKRKFTYAGRRKFLVRRRVKRSIVGKSWKPLTHQFKRVAYTADWQTQTNSGNNLTGAETFSLDKLPDYGDFTDLFDAYRINKVKVEIIGRLDSADYSSQMQMPSIFTAIDTNDNTAPTSVGSIMQYDTVKTTRATRVHKRYFTPKLQTKAYESTVGDGYTTDRRNKFVNADDPSVPHYALKWIISPLTTGGSAQVRFDLKVTYYFDCKQVK